MIVHAADAWANCPRSKRSFMVYTPQSLILTALALFAAFFSYPLLFWFLRRVKRVPVRFNAVVFLAVVAAGLLPVAFQGYEASRTDVQSASMAMVLASEHRIQDTMMLCAVDPERVQPEQIEAARKRLAESEAMWSKPTDPAEITTAQWLARDDKCDHWVATQKLDQVQQAVDAARWWLVAGICIAVVGAIALYVLVLRRMRQDIREVQEEESVELRTAGETLLALFFMCLIIYSPFSLLWLSLFKCPKAATKNSRASV